MRMELLQNTTILVTRPEPQGTELCAQITAIGGITVYLPTIAFAPPTDSSILSSQVQQLDQYDWLIFTSPQAVESSLALLKKYWPALPINLQVAAPGAGTAAKLNSAGFLHVLYPATDWTSEGLLMEPALQILQGQKILLITGEGGREKLADILRARGAIIDYLLVYRRIKPIYSNINVYLDLLKEQKIGIIVCTSGESLRNLLAIVGAANQKFLLDVPLIVVSQRLVVLAKGFNFQNVFLAKNASHNAILDGLCQIKGKGYVR